MIRFYNIRKTCWNEVSDWLVENISKEGCRWWAIRGTGTWDGKLAKFEHDMNLTIEVTEEEEPLLTVFALKYLK